MTPKHILDLVFMSSKRLLIEKLTTHRDQVAPRPFEPTPELQLLHYRRILASEFTCHRVIKARTAQRPSTPVKKECYRQPSVARELLVFGNIEADRHIPRGSSPNGGNVTWREIVEVIPGMIRKNSSTAVLRPAG